MPSKYLSFPLFQGQFNVVFIFNFKSHLRLCVVSISIKCSVVNWRWLETFILFSMPQAKKTIKNKQSSTLHLGDNIFLQTEVIRLCIQTLCYAVTYLTFFWLFSQKLTYHHDRVDIDIFLAKRCFKWLLPRFTKEFALFFDHVQEL